MSAIFDAPVRTSAQNLERVLAAGRPLVLVFETPDCDPCTALVPALQETAREYAGRVLVVRVENSREGNLVTQFRLWRVPTMVFWAEGREIARIEGAADAPSVRAHVAFLLGGPRPAAAGGPTAPLIEPEAPATGGGAARPGAQSATGPEIVTDATFEKQVIGSAQPVLVDFWAPWCGPCRIVSPIVEEMGRQYAGRLLIAKVNTDENPAYTSRLGIQGIPTLILFKNGREVDRIVGAAPKAMLQSRVECVLNAL